MKERFTDIVDSVFLFLLTVCSLQCLVSSFEININFPILAICVAMFTFVFVLVTVYEKNSKKYFVSLGVIFIVYLLMVVVSTGILSNQLKYAVNTVLEVYSRYMVVPKSIGEASENTNGATALFVALSLPICGLLTVFRMRLKVVLPVVIVSFLTLLPCFILINTLPKLLPLLTVLVILFTMYVTSMVHRTNSDYTGVVSSVVAVLMSVLIVGVYILSPVDQYQRKQWQDDLLKLTEFTLFERRNGLYSGKNIRQEINLSDIGPLEQTKTKAMTITSPYSGIVYLKGVAYANYENSNWSILTEEQIENYPAGFKGSTMTESFKLEEATMKIKTVNAEGVIYTPYYLSTVPNFGINDYDVLVSNYKEKINYEVDYKPFWVDEYYPTVDDMEGYDTGNYSFVYDRSQNFINYKNYVYKNYCNLPEALKTEMLSFAKAEEKKILQYTKDKKFEALSTEEIVESVRDYVRSSASYSLDTPKVPQGKDISLWFLNESDTGYCTHFATSTAVMLKALGIPARYVTGYCIYANANSPTEVTSDDAHAWIEYFDDDMGWVPIETTPRDFNTSVGSIESTEPTAQAETEPVTEPTKPTEPLTEQPTNSPKIIPADNNADNIVRIFIAILNALVALIITALISIIALLIRRAIMLYLRKRYFTTGNRNTRVKYLYRYLLKTAKHSYVPIPEEVKSIAEKARFSNTKITHSELDLVLSFTENREKQLITEVSKIKKLYFKYILVLT